LLKIVAAYLIVGGVGALVVGLLALHEQVTGARLAILGNAELGVIRLWSIPFGGLWAAGGWLLRRRRRMGAVLAMAGNLLLLVLAWSMGATVDRGVFITSALMLVALSLVWHHLT
jgi:hypothetical protein